MKLFMQKTSFVTVCVIIACFLLSCSSSPKMVPVYFGIEIGDSLIDLYNLSMFCNTSQFRRNVNGMRFVTQKLTAYIKSLPDVADAHVTIAYTSDRLESVISSTIQVCVIITPQADSDITENRIKIEWIQKLLTVILLDLKEENIVICDNTGMVLNEF